MPIKEKGKVQWFVMRAYKSEKMAEEILQGGDGLKHFIPKRYAVRVYHGVKTRQLVPVIPSLVFVHASHTQIVDFKKRHNFLQFVMRKEGEQSDYLIMSDDQMDSFIKVASQYESDLTYYKPDEIDFKKGVRVRIHGGELDGVTGMFMKVQGKRNRRAVVILQDTMAVATEVQPDLLEIIND